MAGVSCAGWLTPGRTSLTTRRSRWLLADCRLTIRGGGTAVFEHGTDAIREWARPELAADGMTDHGQDQRSYEYKLWHVKSANRELPRSSTDRQTGTDQKTDARQKAVSQVIVAPRAQASAARATQGRKRQSAKALRAFRP